MILLLLGKGTANQENCKIKQVLFSFPNCSIALNFLKKKGNGISIHRSVCPNVSELDERLIDVKWNENIDKKYLTNIVVHTLNIINNKNILIDIIARTSSSDITIQNINLINSNDDNMIEINVLVPNKEKLLKFMDSIKMLENVTSVERIIK